jgi:hypothetical protein
MGKILRVIETFGFSIAFIRWHRLFFIQFNLPSFRIDGGDSFRKIAPIEINGGDDHLACLVKYSRFFHFVVSGQGRASERAIVYIPRWLHPAGLVM